MSAPQTLLDKLWDAHVVVPGDDGPDLLHVDLHLVHEVTSPQAFAGLRARGLAVRRPDLTLATVDHNVPTRDRHRPWLDRLAARQVEALRANCGGHGVPLFDVEDQRQGIVHVVGPEQGLSQPGMLIVCGDSHTSTHGAFGALAFGIGTSEVEHVLATQTVARRRPGTVQIWLEGALDVRHGVSAKDVALEIIARIGVAGGQGRVLEIAGPGVVGLSMEARMTICNMAIEAGARAGLVAPDAVTFAYLEGRPHAPRGESWREALRDWSQLRSDPGATHDRRVEVVLGSLRSRVTWGTTPAQSIPVDGSVPHPDEAGDPMSAQQAREALRYMGLAAGQRLSEVEVDRVFLGSCTNGRLEDLRAAADVLVGRRVAPGVEMLVVPGSGLVKAAAEAEGLDRVFMEAGAQWREPGCSMCLGMNPDRLGPAERCASTSNRNFAGRQGPGGRTHLVSPAVAAATAVTGTFTSPGAI